MRFRSCVRVRRDLAARRTSPVSPIEETAVNTARAPSSRACFLYVAQKPLRASDRASAQDAADRRDRDSGRLLRCSSRVGSGRRCSPKGSRSRRRRWVAFFYLIVGACMRLHAIVAIGFHAEYASDDSWNAAGCSRASSRRHGGLLVLRRARSLARDLLARCISSEISELREMQTWGRFVRQARAGCSGSESAIVLSF